MKKFLSLLIVLQLLLITAGCCCPCAKKANSPEQAPATQPEPEQPKE